MTTSRSETSAAREPGGTEQTRGPREGASIVRCGNSIQNAKLNERNNKSLRKSLRELTHHVFNARRLFYALVALVLRHLA